MLASSWKLVLLVFCDSFTLTALAKEGREDCSFSLNWTCFRGTDLCRWISNEVFEQTVRLVQIHCQTLQWCPHYRYITILKFYLEYILLINHKYNCTRKYNYTTVNIQNICFGNSVDYFYVQFIIFICNFD